MQHTLFILDYFHPYIGGIETLFDDVTNFCADKKMKITVLTSRHNPNLKKIEKKGDVTIYRVGYNRFTIIYSALWFALQHRELFTSINHIHTSTFTSSIPAWIIGKIWGKPVTITIHEIYDTLRYHLKGWKGIFYIWFESIICRLPRSKIITPSQTSKNNIQITYPKLSDKKISVILNQIDSTFRSNTQVSIKEQAIIKQSNNIISSDKLLLFVGRLGYEKGLPYLIEAFSEIKKENSDTKLIIIAPRTSSKYNIRIQQQIERIDRQIKDNYLTNHIIRIDPLSSNEELRVRMSICHIGIIPSMSEGFGYIAVQMQSMGLSLIASNMGSLPEVLNNTQTYFVGYGKVHELYNAIIHQLKHYHIHDRSIKTSIIDYNTYYQLFQSSSKK